MTSETYRLLSFTPALPARDLKAWLDKQDGELLISADLFRTIWPLELEKSRTPFEPGFVALPKADCCQQHPERPTITGGGIDYAGGNIDITVEAKHACGIKQITVSLGELVLLPVPGRPGARSRQPRVRNRNDGTRYEQTWSRDDSNDGTPVRLRVRYHTDDLVPTWNTIIMRVVSTCDTVALEYSDEFDKPRWF
jgi:hypothetical protein